MAVLDSTQFSQLVQQVQEALLAGSQGVGEVEVVTSLTNLVSLPALRLIGATETVVEAPLELLSAPAVEAAVDARKATDDAIVAAVNAVAAADLSEAERKDLEEIKLRTILAGTDAFAKGNKAFAGGVNAENATLYAMQIASYLQTKLEQAQVVILSGKANQDVLDNLNSHARSNILVCAKTREDAYAVILQLRELQKQVAGAVIDAYASFDRMQLSTADSRQATELAYKAIEKMAELSEHMERVIIESVIQTGSSKQAVIRLEDLEKDLLLSRVSVDIAASRARENAELAIKVKEETEQAKQSAIITTNQAEDAIRKAEQAAQDAVFAAGGADSAAGHAAEQAESARMAAERADILSDNPPKIIEDIWWKYDEVTKEYVSTGLRAKGNTGSSFKVIGSFDTLDELTSALPDGSDVDGVYGVGTEPPYTYYGWTYKEGVWGWNSQGQLQGGRGESAYEGAVRMGYAGTEDEYINNPVRNAGLAGDAAKEALKSALYAGEAGGSALQSGAGADIAASRARENAELAEKIKEETEHIKQDAIIVTDQAKDATLKAEQAAQDAIFARGGADNAAGHATEQAESARMAAERSNILSDNPPKIMDGFWWIYSEALHEYIDTGISAEGDGSMFPFSENDDLEVQTGTIDYSQPFSSEWMTYNFPRPFNGVPTVVCTVVGQYAFIDVKNTSATSFQCRIMEYGADGAYNASGTLNYIAILKG